MKLCKFAIAISMILVCFCLASCASNPVADEKKIQADLTAFTSSNLLGPNEKIDKVTIDKRQTLKDQKKDTVWVNVKKIKCNIMDIA